MPGSKLCGARVDKYDALQEKGRLLYTVAPQILETIKKEFPDLAYYFAVPQITADGSWINWFAPEPGTVVPWSAATLPEQERARARLIGVRAQIFRLQQSLRSRDEVGDDGKKDEGGENKEDGKNKEDEARLFCDMLTWMFHHPDDSNRFLVNGRPVLAFWGFTEKGANPGLDPLNFSVIYYSDPPAAPEVRPYRAAPMVRPAVPVVPWWRRRSVWVWLSLALLALVLVWIFGLPTLPPPEPGPGYRNKPPAFDDGTQCSKGWGWCATRIWPGS